LASSNDDLTARTAVELNELLAAGDVSSVEITEQVLARIETVNPVIAAFITVTDELALSEAKAADERRARGESLSAIDGIPYSIKDLDDTAGIRSTHGTKFLEHNVPTEDSAVAAILRSSGGVLLGKTNLPHMGYWDMSDNYVAPTALNPWDTTRTPGGSSGGAAAAIAAGLGPLAQGGDGAGSIRTPAALTGTVGFKGTFGRVPFYPAGNQWTHRVHNGPIARTVADAALMFGVMAQIDDRDPASVHLPMPPFVALDGARPLEGKRALLSVDFGYGMVTNEVAAATRAAGESLRALGAEVVEVDAVPWDNPAGFHAIMYAGGGYPEAYLPHPEWVEPILEVILQAGTTRSVKEVVGAETARGVFYQQVLAVMKEYDFIVTASAPLPAWSAVPGMGDMMIEGKEIDNSLSRAFLVMPFNLTGQPAISIPSGFSSTGLPLGVQIVGRKYEDLEVLQAAAALEKELDLRPAWPTPTFRPEGVNGVIRTV
jgi:Asp-tRNA(Asn)/Glu-tRNA(Gln) amidotransferase A subunit family amidase